MGKVHRRIQATCDGFMVGKFGPIVKRNRFYGLWKMPKHRLNGVSDGLRFFVRNVRNQQKSRALFNHCYEIAFATNKLNRVAFSMAKFRSRTEIGTAFD